MSAVRFQFLTEIVPVLQITYVRILKGNLYSYDKLTLNCCKGLLNSKMLLKTWEYLFSLQKNWVSLTLISISKFPGHRYFGFYDVNRLHPC